MCVMMKSKIVSHDATAIHSTPVDNSQKILLMAGDVDVIGIDEAQFLTRKSQMYVTNWLFGASGVMAD